MPKVNKSQKLEYMPCTTCYDHSVKVLWKSHHKCRRSCAQKKCLVKLNKGQLLCKIFSNCKSRSICTAALDTKYCVKVRWTSNETCRSWAQKMGLMDWITDRQYDYYMPTFGVHKKEKSFLGGLKCKKLSYKLSGYS